MKSKALPKKKMLSTRGLSLKKLLQVSDHLRKSGSGDTDPGGIEYTHTKNGMLVLRTEMTSAIRKNVKFDAWFTFLDNQDKNEIDDTCRVHAQCSCEDYTFTWEYANAAHNAARIFYGNGEAPETKNIGCEPGLCKHLIALAQYAVLIKSKADAIKSKISKLRTSADSIQRSAQYAERSSDVLRDLDTAKKLRQQANDLEKQLTV